MSTLELRELYRRITNIKEPKVAYLDVGSHDKDTRHWSIISKRAVFDSKQQRWKRNTMLTDDLDKWEQVQVNSDNILNAITFDIDEPNLFMYPDEGAPYSVVRNKQDNNFHATYLLKKPFYAKSDKQKRVLVNEIRPQIKRLATSIGADGGYSNITTKNPFNERLFDTTATGQTIPDVWYMLNQFSGELKKLDIFDKEVEKDTHYLSPIFKEIIKLLVSHSKQNIRLLTVGKDKEQFTANMHLYSSQLNINNAKEETIYSITNDVIDRAFFLADDFCSLQKHRSKKAHLARYGNQVEMNKLNIAKAVHSLQLQKIKVTKKKLAEVTGLSYSSITKPKYSKYIMELQQ